MSASRLDAMYRSILLTKFFTKGWGKPENLRRLFEFRKVVSNRDECFNLIDRDYPVTITKEQNLGDCKLLEGYFLTPLAKFLPGIVPEIAQKAHFQVLLPVHWPEKGVKPVCLHLAGTGDHFFWRRRNLMVKPLIKEAGIGGIILENPFYGLRKPTDQVRSSLHNVSDIFVMGGCLIMESLVMFHWCERNGLGPLGVTGLSMGGHMASLAATNWPKPLVLVPCLSWSTASAVFLQGVMSQSINWDLLEDQYLSDGVYREKLSKMVTIVDEAFLAGKKFARTYSEDMDTTTPPNIPYPTTPDPNNKVVQTAQPTKEDTNPDKNLDITYKENTAQTHNIVDVTKNVLDESKDNVPTAAECESAADIESLNEELKKLLEENKISKLLFEKLTSNDMFELEAQDIEEINQLNGDKVKEMVFKYKVALMKHSGRTESQDDVLNSGSNVSHTAPAQKPNSSESEARKDTKTAAIAQKKERTSWNISDITSDLWLNLPFMRSSGRKIDISKIHWRDREALQFMRGVMDECTHLSNFSVPYDTSLIIAVCAQHDAYVPREDVGTLEEIWPGAEVRYVDAGHVTAYILHQSLFRSCIKEAFDRSKKNWKDGKHINHIA